jgi:hypothetical protein
MLLQASFQGGSRAGAALTQKLRPISGTSVVADLARICADEARVLFT